MTQEKRNNIIIILLLAVATLLITYMLPQQGFNMPKYTQGKPWTHAMLTAPTEIPIELDSITAEHITDSINSHFVKIYKRDNAIKNEQLDQLYRALKRNPNVSTAGINNIVSIVTDLYNKGIVDNDSYDEITTGKLRHMRFLHNKSYEDLSTEEMNSVHSAYNSLDTIIADPLLRAALANIKIDVYLQPNVIYDSVQTKEQINDALQKALAPQGVVQMGESIIYPGSIVTPRTAMILQAYEKIMTERQSHFNGINYSIIGQFVFIAMMMIVFYYFMKMIRPRTFANFKKMVFLAMFTTLFIIVVEMIIGFKATLVHAIPFALVPIIITTFCDTRTSFFIYMIVVIITSLVANDQAEFIIIQFAVGNIAIVSIKEFSRRSQLVQCAAYIFMAYSLIYLALTVLRDGNITQFFADRNWWHVFMYFAMNCVVLSFAYVLIFLIEKIFGFTSTITLVEMSDINNKELRQLSMACPGTFQHSLQVSNLASEAAHEIGANTQLARAGALYHDIGKIENPAFFTENQHDVNPHDSLTPEQSARIVIAHVTDGVKRAEKARLPQDIKDMILQHHGTGYTKYFYTQACQLNDGEKVDIAPYRYPGPNPRTKEAAIIMMADSCEAACKSLKEPTEDGIKNLVNKVIDGQIAEGLLNDAPLSFSDVGRIKQTFIEHLRTFYHTRISYPDDTKPQQDEG